MFHSFIHSFVPVCLPACLPAFLPSSMPAFCLPFLFFYLPPFLHSFLYSSSSPFFSFNLLSFDLFHPSFLSSFLPPSFLSILPFYLPSFFDPFLALIFSLSASFLSFLRPFDRFSLPFSSPSILSSFPVYPLFCLLPLSFILSFNLISFFLFFQSDGTTVYHRQYVYPFSVLIQNKENQNLLCHIF